MIKRMSVTIGALVLGLAVSAAAQAQETMTTRPVKFGVGVGGTVPMGDLGKVAGFGWHIQGSAQFGLSALPVGLRGDLMFHSLGGKDNGPDYRFIAGNFNALFALAGEKARPYIIGGVGLYNTRVSAPSSINGGSATNTSTDFGLSIGAGVQAMLAGFNTFIESRLHHVMGDGGSINMVPITVGIIL